MHNKKCTVNKKKCTVINNVKDLPTEKINRSPTRRDGRNIKKIY